MKPDFENIIEIYNNSRDIEKLIFIDVINDLIKGIPKHKKAKKIPQSLQIEEMAVDFNKQMNFKSIKEYNTFIKEMRDFIYKGINIKGKQSGMFNINKGTSLIPKDIKEYYHIIGEEEVKIIHQYRKLFLQNLEHYGFIEIYISKNKEYHKICENFLNEITEIDDKNRRIYIGLNNIKDEFSKKYLQKIQTDYGVDTIKKQIEYLFNDAKIENYLCKENELIKLYKKITGLELPSDEVEFFKEEGILKYKGMSIDFEIGENPYRLLSYLFSRYQEDGVDKYELFEYIYESDDFDLYKQKKEDINAIKNGINRRFKNQFKTNQLFLKFKGGVLYRQI